VKRIELAQDGIHLWGLVSKSDETSVQKSVELHDQPFGAGNIF